jgi:hypothetical protein
VERAHRQTKYSKWRCINITGANISWSNAARYCYAARGILARNTSKAIRIGIYNDILERYPNADPGQLMGFFHTTVTVARHWEDGIVCHAV